MGADLVQRSFEPFFLTTIEKYIELKNQLFGWTLQFGLPDKKKGSFSNHYQNLAKNTKNHFYISLLFCTEHAVNKKGHIRYDCIT